VGAAVTEPARAPTLVRAPNAPESSGPDLRALDGAWRRDPRRYVLVLRFALLNVVGFAFLAAGYLEGIVTEAFAADRTGIAGAIFVAFLIGLALCAHRTWQTNSDLDVLRQARRAPRVPAFLARLRDAADSGHLIDALRLKVSHRASAVRHIANTLVLLGLVGTVVGFIIALSGVDSERAGDVDTLAPMVSQMIAGMSTALYTTLVGAILNIWLMANHQLLVGGIVDLLAQVAESIEGTDEGAVPIR
jgi:hypothetical protein